MIKLTCNSGLVMVKQAIIVWEQKPPQVHEIVLHPSPVDLKGVNEDVFFCNISHQQVLTRTPPLCNSCGHVLGSLGICFVQIKTQTQNRFCTKEQDAVYKSDHPFFLSRKLLQGGFNILMFMTLVIA